jgi:hypothetical protein
VVGAIGMFLGLLIFSNSGNIAGAVGDPVVASGAGSKTGLAIAVISFWVVDAFTNMLQVGMIVCTGALILWNSKVVIMFYHCSDMYNVYIAQHLNVNQRVLHELCWAI